MRIWLGTTDGGALVHEADARVSVFDHGLTVGDGVFETMKVVNGTPFALTRHLRRLGESARTLGLTTPSDTLVREAIADAIAAAELDGAGRLRVTLTGGAGPLGSDRGDAPPTMLVACTPAKSWPEETSITVVPWVRNERSAVVGAKTTSYAENVVALQYAHERGFSEAVFANTRGELCEGTGSNVFVVMGGEVLTPPLSSGCLAGITRELVVEWARVHQTPMAIDFLETADEVFLTSSTRDVHPVTRVDDRTLGIGPVTARLRKGFAARAASDLDP